MKARTSKLKAKTKGKAKARRSASASYARKPSRSRLRKAHPSRPRTLNGHFEGDRRAILSIARRQPLHQPARSPSTPICNEARSNGALALAAERRSKFGFLIFNQ